ncbi:hypothetical protein [Tenacibaculum aestuarii]|uniref:hypothetical protein n=1 Tax=Tenacibaculum aestuarii TaxID=362781 RepID=UPI00389461E3
MNYLVKILCDDNGEPRDKYLQHWHYVKTTCGDSATLCDGEYFGFGASGCEYETKSVKKGGITCPKCLDFIREIKSIKL